ncbi:MAG: PEGA domain-containing protein [Deltaproteobacteria bacterium]|nr:PEGA domain-containing protein [Deltaproteobacteria bacterium]
MARVWGTVFLCAACLAPRSVMAARLAVLTVGGPADAETQRVGAEYRERLLRALAGLPGVELAGEEAIGAYFAEPSDPAAACMEAEARERLAQGQRWAGRLKPQKAIEDLKEALRVAQAVFPHPGSLALLAEIHLQLGLTHHALGQQAAADEAFETVLLLEPERQLDETVVNPLAVERFEQVRQGLLRSMKGSASLISRPPGARASVDGRDAGSAPVTIPDLLPGKHYFTLRLEGYRTWSGVLEVEPGRVARQEVFLAEGRSMQRVRLLSRLGAGGLGSASAADAEALRAGLDVEGLVLLRVLSAAGRAMIEPAIYVRGGPRIDPLGVFAAEQAPAALAERVRRYLAGERASLAGLVQPPGGGAPGGLPPPEEVPPPGPAWYERWWVWTIAGVVVAGAVATGTALALSRDSGLRVDVIR